MQSPAVSELERKTVCEFRIGDLLERKTVERKTGFELATLTLARWWFSSHQVWRLG
jgi:hypothetical protein